MSVTTKLLIQETEARLARATDPAKRARIKRDLAAHKRTDRATLTSAGDAPDDDEPEEKTCAKCGEENDAGAKFCDSCGEELPDDDADPDEASAAARGRAEARAWEPVVTQKDIDATIATAMRHGGPLKVSLGGGMSPLTFDLDRVPAAERPALRRMLGACERRGTR